MLTSQRLKRRKKIDLLLGAAISLAAAALASLILFFDADQLGILSLGLWGLLSMGLALFLVSSSSSYLPASIGVWFTSLLALQHGGGWILETIFTDQHYTRFIVFDDYTLAKSVALAGTGLLAFSFAYTFYNASRGKRSRAATCVAQDRNPAIDQVPWAILFIWGAGILIFELLGGMNLDTDSLAAALVYVLRSTFGHLAGALVTLISIKLLASRLRTSTAFLILLILWTVFVLLTGQRQAILGISFTVLVLSSKWRLATFRMRQMLVLISFLLMLMLGMTFLRDAVGRDSFSMTVFDQLATLSEVESPSLDRSREALEYDLGYRLNASNVLLGQMADQPLRDLFWFEPLTYSLIKLTPGVLWVGKPQDLPVGELPRLISMRYGLPDVDYIATYLTIFYAMGSLPTLILLCSLFGIVVAFLDIKLAQSTGVVTLVLAIGVVGGLLTIDHSIDALFIQIRNSFLLFLLIKLSMLMGNRGHSVR